MQSWPSRLSEKAAARSEESSELVLGPTPELPVPAGTIVAHKYLVQGLISHGGMGIICAGLHVDLEQPVAIKLMRRELAREADLVDRFLNEARAAASLKSPHVVRVLDVGQLPDGLPYLVMERLVGFDLDTLVYERGALAPGEAVNYMIQACEALSEAHALGIIHRDIKPENLFLTRGPNGRKVIKLLDFGVAKRLGVHRRVMTRSGHAVGSPWYMSPEQMSRPNEVDARSDLWSLGVVLFRLLTGHLPFEGDTVAEVCARVLEAPTPDALSLRPTLDPGLVAVVERCLCKHREARYRSADALAEALAPFAGEDAAGPYSHKRLVLDAQDEVARPTDPGSALTLPRSVPPAVSSVRDPQSEQRPAFARRTALAAAPWLAAVAAAVGGAMAFAEPESRSFVGLDGLTDGWLTAAPMESALPLPEHEHRNHATSRLMPRGFVLMGTTTTAQPSAGGLRAEVEPETVDVSEAIAPDVPRLPRPAKVTRRQPRKKQNTDDPASKESQAAPAPNEAVSEAGQPAADPLEQPRIPESIVEPMLK